MVEDLRIQTEEDIHSSRLKRYDYRSLNECPLLSHVLLSNVSMFVRRLIKFVDAQDGLNVLVRWKGLPTSKELLALLAIMP